MLCKPISPPTGVELSIEMSCNMSIVMFRFVGVLVRNLNEHHAHGDRVQNLFVTQIMYEATFYIWHELSQFVSCPHELRKKTPGNVCQVACPMSDFPLSSRKMQCLQAKRSSAR